MLGWRLPLGLCWDEVNKALCFFRNKASRRNTTMPVDSLVSQINRPELEGCRRSSIIAFREDYDEYKRRIEAANANRQPRDRLRMATIRECIKPDLLESMCMMSKIPGAATSADLTDELVNNWYEGLLEVDPAELTTRLNEVVNSVKHDPDPVDPSGGVVDYIHQVMTKIRQLGMGNIMSDERQARQVINRLVNGLRPAELRERLTRERTMWTKSNDGDLAYFSQRAEFLAREVQASVEARERTVKKESTGHRSGESRARGSKRSDHREARSAYRASSSGDQGRGSSSKTQGQHHTKAYKRNIDGDGKWTRKCLNTECSGTHKIEDCPITNEEEKKRLLSEHIEKLKSNSSNKRRKTAGKSVQTQANEYNIEVEIGGVSTVARDDTGADISIIPFGLWERIRGQDSSK